MQNWHAAYGMLACISTAELTVHIFFINNEPKSHKGGKSSYKEQKSTRKVKHLTQKI